MAESTCPDQCMVAATEACPVVDLESACAAVEKDVLATADKNTSRMPVASTPRTPHSPLASRKGRNITLPSAAFQEQLKSSFMLPPTSLTFKQLGFSLPQRNGESKVILEPCSGHLKSNKLVALMGPSGSGKTTLLDMLAMKKTASYTGEVFVNGRSRDRKLFQRVAAYVGQEDIMPAHWTVWEAIAFNANLKCEPGRSHQETKAWIEVLIEAFGLRGVEHTLVGGETVRGISGGQRRRVSLARGVAARASILFCDEPTTGLSATDAEFCISALSNITESLGVLCVVVIHQPRVEVAKMFDRLILLTSSPGRMVYCGEMSEAQAFWEDHGHPVPATVSPIDFFLDMVTPGTSSDVAETLVELFQEEQFPRIEEQVTVALQSGGMTIRDMLRTAGGSNKSSRTTHRVSFPIGEAYTASTSVQLRMLLDRKVRIILRNPLQLALPVLIPMVQGFLVGYMFEGIGHSKDLLRQMFFIFCLLTMLCLAGTMSLAAIMHERTLMKYEVSEKLYSEGAWALVAFLIDVPLALAGATCNVAIMAHIAGLEAEIFQVVFCWSVLLFFVYDSLFACIGAIAKDIRQAQAIATPIVGLLMLCNGMLLTKADAPPCLRWIFDVSPNSYAMEGIVTRVAEDFPFQGPRLIKELGYSEGHDERGLKVMLSMIVVLRVAQLFGLKFLNHIQK